MAAATTLLLKIIIITTWFLKLRQQQINMPVNNMLPVYQQKGVITLPRDQNISRQRDFLCLKQQITQPKIHTSHFIGSLCSNFLVKMCAGGVGGGQLQTL